MGVSTQKEIEIKKKISEIQKKAMIKSKQEKCLLCGETCQSFCNSHIIPQFVLNNIADEGHLLRGIDAFRLKDNPIMYRKKGVNNTWTFKVICEKCDKKYFADYETEESLLSIPTTKVMAEIGLKSTMMQIGKRLYEVCLYNEMANSIKNKELLDEEQTLDLRDYRFDFKRLKKIIDKDLKSGMTLLYYKVLDYVVPVAMQGPIAVHRDLDGEIVNDVNNFDHKIKMQSLFCCVFPLKNKTVIQLFHLRDDRNYKKFDRKFLKLNEEDKISYINYLIFKYCEHYAISPKINKEILTNQNLIDLTWEHNDSHKKIQTVEDLFVENKRLINWREIPNLLSWENRLK